MKLIGELKKRVEAASSKEEARAAIAEAGMELTPDELDLISGGETFVGTDGFTYYNYHNGTGWHIDLGPNSGRSIFGLPQIDGEPPGYSESRNVVHVNCPICGEPVLSGIESCPYCGSPLSNNSGRRL